MRQAQLGVCPKHREPTLERPESPIGKNSAPSTTSKIPSTCVAAQSPPSRNLKRKMPALNALKAFEVAGRTGSFTRAAELLNVTQSAVSRQVRQLEEQLGETLL